MRRGTIDTGRRGMRNGGGALTTPRIIKVVDSLSSANYYQRGASTVCPGSTSMTCMGLVYCKSSSPLTTDFTIATKYTTGTRGWLMRVIQGTDRVAPTVVNGTPTAVSEVVSQSGFVAGKFYTFGFRLNGGVLDAFYQGAQIGAPGTAVVGYTAANATENLRLGVASASSNWALAAVAFANSTAVSDVNIAAWHAQVVAGNTFTFPGGGTTSRWYAGDADAGGGVAATTWVDPISSANLTKVANPTITTIIDPVFA